MVKIELNSGIITNESKIYLSFFCNQWQSNKVNSIKDIDDEIWNRVLKDIPKWTQAESIKDSYINSIDLNQYLAINHKNRLSSNLQEILFNIVILSKDSHEIARASSNAIAILSKFGYSFNNKDLQSINAPNADFSQIYLFNINFKNSNLSSADFSESYLYQVNFSNCNLENAKFSPQKHFIKCQKLGKYFDVSSCGKYLATFDYELETVIKIWELESDKLIKTIECKVSPDQLCLLRFSPCTTYISTIKAGRLTLCDVWNESLEIKFFEDFYDATFCFAFSSCETYIAAGSHGKIRIWNLKSKKLIHKSCEHRSKVAHIAFSPCNRFLYSISYDTYIFVWNFAEKNTIVSYYKNNELKFSRKKAKRLLKRIKIERENDIKSFVPSKCGRFIIVAAANITVWNINLNEKVFIYNSNNCFEVIFNMRNLIAFKSGNEAIMALDIETQNVVYHSFCHRDNYKKLVFLPRGNSIAAMNEIKSISILEIYKPNCAKSVNKCFYTVNCIASSPCSEFFVTHSGNALIELWEVKSHKMLNRIEKDSPNSAIKAIIYSPCGSYIVTPKNSSIHLYSPNLDHIQEIKDDTNGNITAFAISPDERYILSGSYYNKITLWEIKNIKKYIVRVCYINLSVKCTYYLGFWNYQEMIIFYEHMDCIKVWDIKEMKYIDILQIQTNIKIQVLEIQTHKNTIGQVSICKDYLAYLSTNSPSQVFLYNFKHPSYEVITPLVDRKSNQNFKSQLQDSITPFNKENSTYTALKFSPSGAYLAALWTKNIKDKSISEIHIWQAENKEFIARIREYTNSITSFEFSPCEDIIIAASSNLTIKFWNWKILI